MSPWRMVRAISCFRSWGSAAFAFALAAALAGCDREVFKNNDRTYEQAEQKRSAQEYRPAITLYEKALDNDKKAADAHFRMAMIYDANLDDPISAVHHFNRYIEMLPNGAHAKEARDSLKRIEPILATKLAGGTLISHADAMKLRQENKDLRDQLAQKNSSPPPGGTPAGGPNAGKLAAREAERRPAPARAPTWCSRAIRWRASHGSSTARKLARRTFRTPT